MRRLGIRLAAVVATAMVLVSGAFWFRELLVENRSDYVDWSKPTTIEVDADAGVLVSVERGRPGDGVVADLQWWSRSTFGGPEVIVESGLVTARCRTPTPLSRCAIWLTVRTADPAVRVVVIQRPGATLGGIDQRLNVEVRPAP